MPRVLEPVKRFFQVPFYHAIFLRIAEPRVIRVLVFLVYLGTFVAGMLVLADRPEQFLQVLGTALVNMYAALLITASVIGAISVLPGIWWLERVALILMVTNVSWYLVIILTIGGRPVAVGFVIGFGLFLVARFIEIRGAQLAPREE